jgi:fatty-acyl-CoA synthase
MPLRFAEKASQTHDFPLTIGHLLDSATISAADQEIVYRDQVRLTYREFRARIGRLASLLTQAGADQGVTVAVMDWDSHRYLEAYFAVPMMGAVLQMVNIRLSPAQIAYTLQDARAEILIVHRDFLPLVEQLLPSLPMVKAVLAIMEGGDDKSGGSAPPWTIGDYEALLAAAPADFAFCDFDENAVATTFYTTGTTGKPKGVCFTHRQLVLHSLAINAPFGSQRRPGFGIDDVYMPMTPMFHVHAWGMPYVATMLGVKQVYPGRYDPDMLLDLREREGVSYSHCVPTILQMLLAAADRRQADLTGWKMTIGGSQLTHHLYHEARRFGMHVGAGYGMSETAPTISLARPMAGDDEADDDALADAMTMSGVPIPLVSARIVDAEMNELPHDGKTRGELVLRAPWLTPCYVGNAAASEALWRGGWLHTQDVATIDRSGRLQIRDRLKDVIKSGGEWICSLTIEDMLNELPEIADIAVIGVPDERWGERPIAVIVAAPDRVVTEALVGARIETAIARGEISGYARLDRIELVDRIPVTSVGKADKKALRAQFAGTAPAVAVASN